jgi:hypothetical protein
MDNQATPTQAPADSTAQGGQFSVLIYGLCGLIIVLLAGLWIAERGQRTRAEARVRNIDIAIAQQQKKMQSFGRLIATQAAGAKIMRNSLPTKQATLDGETRTVLLLDAEAAYKAGLQPGDVIVVKEPAEKKSVNDE